MHPPQSPLCRPVRVRSSFTVRDTVSVLRCCSHTRDAGTKDLRVPIDDSRKLVQACNSASVRLHVCEDGHYLHKVARARAFGLYTCVCVQ